MRLRSAHKKMVLSGLMLALFLLLSWSLPETVLASIYEIEGIEVQIALPLSSGQSPRSVGLARAENKAFTLLFNRMLTRGNQDLNQDFLDTLRREKHRFIQRSVVRAEKQRPDAFQISVDVTFSKKEVVEAFAKAGMSHGQSLYPNSLLVTRADSQNNQNIFQYFITEESKLYGIPLRHPLGDMDDMLNLSWQSISAANASPNHWVQSRYGLDSIWAVQVSLESEPASAGFYRATAQLIEKGATRAKPPIIARAEGTFPSEKEAQTNLFQAISRQLLQQISDQWITQNSVEPLLRHMVPIRIIHRFNHKKYNQFLQSLQHIPGFTGFQFSTLSARDVVIQVDYQGLDNTLLSSITQLGVQVQTSPDGLIIVVL
ncbi:MAG: DUF2066 domain-containing protein [Magnetococcales bacterium]|nr:DUF2066 domain-containing protein [Magnetococcales bacterium]